MQQHLIANSGIQFYKSSIEIDTSAPLQLDNGKSLQYNFCEVEDFLAEKKVFNIALYNEDKDYYVPVQELYESGEFFEKKNSGREILGLDGLPQISESANTDLLTKIQNDEIYSFKNLGTYKVRDPKDHRILVSAFSLLVGKWLPMPMFEQEDDGISSNIPMGWCRVKIVKEDESSNRYTLVWAFDTKLADNPVSLYRPYMEDYEEVKNFSLCNRTISLNDFIANSDDVHAFSDYIASLLGINPDEVDESSEFSFKHLGFYIYLINFIRLYPNAAPEIALHNVKDKAVDVDLVVDIGNSRTCGVLFENSDFTKAKMLSLADLSSPWKDPYEKSFDMRIVFRKADFGDDIILPEEEGGLFQWRSFVRIGNEAKHLIYSEQEQQGLSQLTTNYSSPKRYLWDEKPFEGKWNFLTTVDDPFSQEGKNIFIDGLSPLFDNTGKLDVSEQSGFGEKQFSRSSLMTFVFIEILQQARLQINSISFRTKHGNIDFPRRLRNIIVTCPTAMSIFEQVKLRQSAVDAWKALSMCDGGADQIQIIPSPVKLKRTDPNEEDDKRTWTFDEATASQLVYLYAEIEQRYSGDVAKFIEQKGHKRPEFEKEGYSKKSLTIGTIDIGAGTTDVIVCSYKHCQETNKLQPVPKFWDSFNIAGDDILYNIIRDTIIDGPEKDDPNIGSISSALKKRLLSIKDKDEDLLALPCLAKNAVYKDKIKDIVRETRQERRTAELLDFASCLIHDFFGNDSNMMSAKDRIMRIDFNTQISLPIAQFLMEELRCKRGSRVFSFKEIFVENKPAQYLLEFFKEHFGFSIEELNWRYDEDEISDSVRKTLEPIMKQLSIVLHAYYCDAIVLAGRPSSLDAVTELCIKYVPTTPDRLIRFNDYHVGNWYPFADGQGYFIDQKPVVAVGAMVGYLASTIGFNSLSLDMSQLLKTMSSTANYLGSYNNNINSEGGSIDKCCITPKENYATINITSSPHFIGCKQFNSLSYEARPLLAIYNHSRYQSLDVSVSRIFEQDKETLSIEDVVASSGQNVDKKQIEIIVQTLTEKGTSWLDKGEFKLSEISLKDINR